MTWVEADSRVIYHALDRHRQQQVDDLTHRLLEEQRDEQAEGATT